MKITKLNLYLNVADKSYTITNDTGEIYSVEEARLVIESGRLANCNLALVRLFEQFQGNVEDLKKYYDGVTMGRIIDEKTNANSK
jgi:hypothetical protein